MIQNEWQLYRLEHMTHTVDIADGDMPADVNTVWFTMPWLY